MMLLLWVKGFLVLSNLPIVFYFVNLWGHAGHRIVMGLLDLFLFYILPTLHLLQIFEQVVIANLFHWLASDTRMIQSRIKLLSWLWKVWFLTLCVFLSYRLLVFLGRNLAWIFFCLIHILGTFLCVFIKCNNGRGYYEFRWFFFYFWILVLLIGFKAIIISTYFHWVSLNSVFFLIFFDFVLGWISRLLISFGFMGLVQSHSFLFQSWKRFRYFKIKFLFQLILPLMIFFQTKNTLLWILVNIFCYFLVFLTTWI